jgi:hypothetical protein
VNTEVGDGIGISEGLRGGRRGRRGRERTCCNIETPPGWFPPVIDIEERHNPRERRASVGMNLMMRWQDERHGVQALTIHDVREDTEGEHNLDADTEVVTDAPQDCKETPGSGCDSAEKLRLIHEGKRLMVQDSEGAREPRRRRDSLGWYNSCTDVSEFCSHRSLSGGSPAHPVTLGPNEVWV